MENVVMVVLGKGAYFREEGLQRFRMRLVEYRMVYVVVLYLVAYAVVDGLLQISVLC